MPLTYEQKKDLERRLADPNAKIDDADRDRVKAAIRQYDDDYLARARPDTRPWTGMVDEPSIEAPPPAAPFQASWSGGMERKPVDPDAARVKQIVNSLDPKLSLPAQVLSMQPATTHPGGDEAAKDEWVYGDLKNPKGLVVYHEAPAQKVREELLANPQLFHALQLSVPDTPEGVMSIQAGDSTHQAYNDYKFHEAAKHALSEGKTIYRRSKAPWLGDGKNAALLDSMKTKLDTMPWDGVKALVLGYDDTAHASIGRAAQESGKFDQKPIEEQSRTERALAAVPISARPKFDTVGGVPEDLPTRDYNAIAAEEHPGLYHAGQAAGILSPWGFFNKLYGAVFGGAAAKTALGGLASGAVRGAAASGAEQTVREGAQAASNYAATGDTGTTLGESAERIGGSALGGAAIPAALRGAQGAGNQISELVKTADRYKGAPDRLAAHGVETQIGRGHVPPPVVTEAAARGRLEGGRSPLTVLAGDLEKPLMNAAVKPIGVANAARESEAAAHYASPEGGFTLPSRNLVEAAASKLRTLMSPVKKKLKGIAKPGSETAVHGIFNKNIEGVSARPTKNGVELTAKEARAFLNPEWQKKLDLDKIEASGGKVYVTPRRYTSEAADKSILELAESKDADVLELRDALMKDRQARAGGAWAKRTGELDAAVGKAEAEATAIGADKPGGVRAAVTKAGKSKGQDPAIQGLRNAAANAGGKAPEQLRGALTAEDLAFLKAKAQLVRPGLFGGLSALGSLLHPGLGALVLGSAADRVALNYAYPAARKLAKLKPGAVATRVGRGGATVVRNIVDDRDEERRKKENEKNAEGYEERAKAAGSGKKTRRRDEAAPRRRESRSER